jgi:hypothetical protein
MKKILTNLEDENFDCKNSAESNCLEIKLEQNLICAGKSRDVTGNLTTVSQGKFIPGKIVQITF